MKPAYLFMFITIFSFEISHAQEVGIGTISPHASAALEVHSTTKGFLVPSMTQTQRALINNPAEGLLVYDLTVNKMYVFRNNSWQYFIDNSYWNQSSSGNKVYNSGDSVGIGNSSPIERLHVSNGNMRLTGDLKMTGDAGIGVTSPEQRLHVRSSNASEGILLEAINPILQLRQSNTPSAGYTDKGFVQLAGDDIRIGTNSANDIGKFIIRTNSTDQVFVDNNGNMGIDDATPTEKLEVNGNIRVTGEVKSTITGDYHLLPNAYGSVTPTGSIYSPASTPNFTVEKVSTGYYRIRPTNQSYGVMVANVNTSGVLNALPVLLLSGYDTVPNCFSVKAFNLQGTLVDTSFNFVLFTQNN